MITTPTLNIEQDTPEAQPSEEEFILVKIEQSTFVVPSVLIAEILTIEKTQILPLPFYKTDILGCIHHEGNIVPLIAANHLLGLGTENILRPMLTVLRFSQSAKHLSGVGFIVNQLLGSKSRSQLPSKIFESSQSSTHSNSDQTMNLFHLTVIDPSIWDVQQWSVERMP